MHRKFICGLVAALLAGFMASGCTKAPTEKVQEAEAVVDSARNAGAVEYAREDFNAASTMLQEAKVNMDSGQYSRAKKAALLAIERGHVAMVNAAANKGHIESTLKDSLAAIHLVLDSVKVHLQAALKERHLPLKVLKTEQDELKNVERSLTMLEGKLAGGELLSTREEAGQLHAHLAAIDEDLSKAHSAAKGPIVRKRRGGK
jgi:hypothetical protein